MKNVVNTAQVSGLQKIFNFALSKKFAEGEDLAAIMEVVNATSDPEVAILILLGLYKEPVLDHKERTSLPSRSDVYTSGKVISAAASFERYDKFNKKVNFSCIIKTERTRWFKTQESANEYSNSGKTSYDYSDTMKDLFQYEAKFTQTESRTGSCSVESWNTL